MSPPEPEITINGTKISEAQAMALRVSVGWALIDLTQDSYALGHDQEGMNLREAYIARLHEVQRLMMLKG